MNNSVFIWLLLGFPAWLTFRGRLLNYINLASTSNPIDTPTTQTASSSQKTETGAANIAGGNLNKIASNDSGSGLLQLLPMLAMLA